MLLQEATVPSLAQNLKSDAAAYPIIGGIAPTTAPTHVFNQCTCFKGVYTHAYNKIFPPPNIAVASFVYSFKYHIPQIPLVTIIQFPTDNLPSATAVASSLPSSCPFSRVLVQTVRGKRAQGRSKGRVQHRFYLLTLFSSSSFTFRLHHLTPPSLLSLLRLQC